MAEATFPYLAANVTLKDGGGNCTWTPYGDAAWQVFEEALAPALDSLRRFQRLGLMPQAKLQCMGILWGIQRFEKESDSEFKAWAGDAPGEYFASTYREWRNGTTSREEVTEVRRFVKRFCPKRADLCR